MKKRLGNGRLFLREKSQQSQKKRMIRVKMGLFII
jgi:hypothetical protein